MAQDQENSYKLWQALSNDYDMGSYEQFKKDVQDATKRQKLYNAIKDEYDLPDFDGFSKQLGIVSTAAEQRPTGQAGGGESTAQVADQTTSAGEMVAQGTAVDQLSDQMAQKTDRMPEDVQTKVQVKPGTTQQKAAPVYKYTYFDESAIDPNEGELRMSMKPANWAYSERVNKSRGSHTKDNSPILRMSLDGGKLDVDVEREALAELKGMSDDEIYKYTNDLYNLTWGELTNEQRRDAASRLAAAGYELHVRDLGLGHAGDVDRNTDEVQTNLQDPKYRKLYDQGQWADPVDALSRQYDRLFAEQATGGTMGQQQATKMANRVLRAADKDQMFTWALQEAERTGGDPYKIYENIYDRFHAAVKDKLGAYNTRGQAAGLLGDIDAMIAEKWRAAEEADRSRGFNFGQVFADAENGGTRIADRLMDDPDMWALEYAKRTIEGVNNMIAEADHNAASGNFGAWLESSFAGGAARGFGQAVFDVRTWDMGFGDVRDATALMTALDKSDKGQPLTKAEQAMLDAKAVELAANAYFKSQVGYGYEAGKVTGESLPFMLEMMINPASKTGGLAVNKLVRYALKRFPQRGAAAVERQAVRAAERQAVRSAERSVARSLKGKVLESAGLVIETAGKKTAAGKAVRAAVKTAGNIAGSAVMAGTTGLPGVVADTQKRMIGQLDYDTDESGAAHVTGHGFGVPMIEAFKQALVARGIENVTEMSEFDVLSNWLGGLTRKALDKLHMSDVYKFFDDIRMSDVAKVVQDFEKNTHWQGTFGEYLEEVEGGILNAWLVGDQTLDQDPETGVFNVDNNVKTFLGVSLLGGAFSTVQTVGYRTPKARMRKDIEDADKQASELWGGTWQQFKNSVDGADDEEMEALLANIVVNGNYSVDQRRAAAQYIKSVVAYRGAMKGEEIRAVDGESNPEDEQSYEQGYQVQGREREQVQDDLQRAEQRLDELDFDLSSFEGWTSDAFERRIASGEHEYTDEDIEAIREYFRAKAASDGMHQRVEDDIETQVQQASDLVDKQTNQGTGMVHRATLNDGQEVYVTGGQLVMTGDGTMIDTEASDQSLFVYNPATGQPEQYNPSDFQSVDDPVNPEQLKSEAARDIRQAFAQQAEADMNGYVQQGESYDMVDEQGNALHGTVLELRPDNTAVVQVDGEQIPLAVQTQQLQTWVDNAKQARMSVEPAALPTRSAGARDNTANTGRVDNATNETIEAPAVEPMVMDEQTGEPAWLQSTPERGYQYLTGESGLSGEDITSLIDDRIAQADAAIAKASKGGTIDQRLHARQAKDYWEGVKALHDAAKNAAQQRPTVQAGTNGRGTTASQGTGTSAQQSPTGQPTTTGQTAPAGTVRVEANQAETMPVGYTAVNIDGTRADDRGQLGIRPEDEAYFLKTMNPRMMGLLNKVAKSLGWKIRLYNGVNSKERGLYNDGVVWVNRRAMTSKLAQWILGHEMTHGMGSRTRRGETFKDYKAMATAYHRRQVGDEQYEREVAALIKAYQDHLRSLGMDTSVVTREYVEEEIACDVTGDLLMNNPEMIGKLFSGVESPSKLKRIIDMIVDALDWIKKKLTFRSEEKQAFDDLIQRLNNLYRDAKAQTDIAKATAREEGSQVESGKEFNAETMQLEEPSQSAGTGDRVRFSISERTDEAGNEVYTETREDGTKDREVVTMPDGSRDVTWFDEAGRKKEVLSYYPNGEVRQVSNYDSEGDLTRLIQYDENRRAIRHWEPRIGTDWERDENGVARGMSNGVYITPYGSRFSLAPTFYSNAARAVEGVKQEKAKAEQWKAMLTKAGGIKAGEDKWMGLSTWLDEHKGETLTKEQVRQFVAENGIQMEETHYSEYLGDAGQEQLDKFRAEYADAVAHVDDIYKAKAERFSDYCNTMEGRYGEDWFGKMTQQERMTYNVLARDQEQADPQINDRNDIAFQEMVDRYGDDFGIAFEVNVDLDGKPTLLPNLDYNDNINDAARSFLGIGENTDELINQTRSRYTTEGLENKREIAFVVPNVEPYQEDDEIHFGPENQGRAVMWVRFGETRDADGNRVLVIDEIQSNRHQDAREKGYKVDEKTAFAEYKKAIADYKAAEKRDDAGAMKDAEQRYNLYGSIAGQLPGGRDSIPASVRDAIPAAPFEKNWHEVAMKRMLRLAAEEGFDKVAWTTGTQQAERYDIGNAVERIEKLDDRAFLVYPEDGSPYQELEFDEDGVYRDDDDALLNNKTMADIFGKETAEKLKNLSDGDQLTGEGLRIGGEGMKAFYDKMLPQFMNKYGKRWGVKVGEVTLNTPGKEVMHSVDVNEDMKRSVMQGQPLFSLSAEQQEKQIHSENFKRWFGDWENDPEHASKVVDEDGKPLVVYHQTNAKRWINRETGEDWEKLDWRKKMEWENKSQEEWEDAWEEQDFYEFDDRYARQSIEMPAIFFSPNNDPYHEYGQRTIAAYLDIKNPAINPDIPNRGVTDTAGRDAMEALKTQGYDGFIRTDEDGNILEYGVFDSNQVKSATENNGDFSRENPDIRYSLSEEDRDYMDAVDRGDTAKASRMVAEAAKRAMPDTKVVDENGEPLVMYHTTTNEFTVFDKNRIDTSGHGHYIGFGFNFASHQTKYGPNVMKVYLDAKHPLRMDTRTLSEEQVVDILKGLGYRFARPSKTKSYDEQLREFVHNELRYYGGSDTEIYRWISNFSFDAKDVIDAFKDLGFDSSINYGFDGKISTVVVFDPEQIKSAEAVTRDDNGEVIPLSQRFDEGKKDIRFSLSGDGTVEEYNKAVNMTGRTFNVGGREVKPGITRYNFQEAFQDSILAVKKLQQVVERHFGIKLPTRENAWMYENRLSSINMHERKSFIEKVYEPMMKIADAIMKRGVKEKELNAYLICKHGLERNQVFAMRDANEEANEIVRNGGTPDMQQLIDKYRQRDYSGLTGVTGIQGDITDIEAEAQRIVDEFEQRHGQLCNELWDAIRKATQWSLRKSYQSGMMSAATFDHVRNMFQYYVPLRGWSETTAEDVYSYMMGEHGAFNGVLKRAEGRTSVADDPLATIGNMAESALIQGNRNLLKQHLLRMAQNHPTDVCQVRDVWLVEGPGGVWEPHWPNIPEDATPDEIDQILQDHEADMQQLEASGQAKRVRNNLDIPYRIDPRHVPEHAVVAKVAGVDHVVYINGNPRAAQAINGQTGAGRGTKSGFSRLIDFIFGDVKRFYSSVLTSLNINFSGANFVRDLPHAYAMTFMKQGPLKAAEYIAKSFQVIPWVFKNQLGKTGTSQMDRYFQEFLSSGAVTGYAHINDVDAWKANNKRRFARLSALGKAKVAVPRALGEVINTIGWFSETLELIPRFTAFLTERQAGKDIATATKAAKDITTNFNKKGSEVTPGVWGAVANTLRYMKMFFNPIVQGMYQFVDVASMGKENKWVGPRMVLATMHLPVLGAIVPYLNQFLLEALGGDDDDDYWLLNEYTRRNNVCIFTGNGYLKIPIAPVFRELYGMGEVVATRHAGKADNEKTTIDLIDQLRTMGSVEGQSSYNEWSLARFLLPEHFAPLIDVMNNENFTGGPIYYDNNYKEYAPEYTKAKKSTWSPLVAASKWLNEMMGGDEDIAAGNSGKWMNPAVWQHLITNVGGGFAQLAGDVVAGVTDITEGKEIDPSNIPVMKRFYSGSSDERANWARFGIYKDFEKDYTMAKEKYQALDKRGLSLTERADEMVKFAESHPKAAAIYAVWEGGIKGADIPARLEKLGKDDPAYWDLVKEAVAKAEKAMNSGYVRAWEQKRKDRPDSMSDKELNDRFDKSDNDSIRHIMADEISKRAGSQDYYGRDAQAAWSDKSVAAWEAYQDQRTSDDIKADAELSNLLKVDEDEKDKARIKMLGYIKDELNKIRRGKDATSRSAGVTGLGEGDDQRVMNELRAARKQLIEDLKNGSAEQAYRNLERRTMRLGLRKKAKEL